MPLYEYECQKCERRETAFRHVGERHDAPRCHNKPMRLIIMPSYVQDDIPPYISPTTGRVIGSRSARRDDLKRSRARPWEGFEQEVKEAQRRARYAQEKFDKQIEDTAHRIFNQLPPSKRRVLDGGE